MGANEQQSERKRRDWIIILIILLLGFLCVILAGGSAIRFAPHWKLDTNMGSNLDPNSNFLTNVPSNYIEPLDPSILTQPVWVNVFLTPGALLPSLFPTTTPITSLPTNPPIATNTTVPTAVNSPIPPTATPIPTNTLIYYPPPPNTSIPPPPPTNTPLPSVDLAVTKDDGNGSYIAGGTLTYTITIINNGPDNVTGAILTDNKPVQITTWDWACTAQNGGATGCDPVTNSNTNFTDTVDLPNGASIVYTVTVGISGGATNDLVNTAIIKSPSGYTETNSGNNSFTDTDTLTTTSADLFISKDDGVTTVYNGDTVIYTVRVTNSGPGNVTGAILSDPAVSGLTKASVACSATPGQCLTPPSVAQLETGFALPTLINGQFYEITISANVTAISGTITNTGTVTAPVGVNDPNITNNSAPDSDTVAPKADLQITKTDNSTDYVANAWKTYSITVYNDGPSDVNGANVTDIFSTNTNIDQSTPIVWGCLNCTPILGGIGDINRSVNIPSKSSVTFTALVRTASSPSGSLVNTATVTEPGGVYDPNGANNTATDTDTLFKPDPTPPGIGTTPNGTPYNIPAGTYITLQLGKDLVVGSGNYLVYYEFPQGTGIWMDAVRIQIGNGSNWYTVFNWGDGNADTNTNIPIPLLTNPTGTCAGEPDNCEINGSLLYTSGAYSTGIIINVDGVVPNGTYPYIRIFSPSSPPDTDGWVEVDAIQVLP